MIRTNNFGITGLSIAEVLLARKKYGHADKYSTHLPYFYLALISMLKEPMVILLLVTSAIYFFTGQFSDAIVLCCSIAFVVAISLFQDSRSKKAMEKLSALSQPNCKVIRAGQLCQIKTQELVVGDSLIIEEGNSIAADGTIVHANDFAVNESLLTGEALPVFKDENQPDHFVYQGTAVTSGLAIVTVTALGKDTRVGEIGTSLSAITIEKTPLELQINSFVKKMVLLGTLIFILVWVINYFRSQQIIDSLLKALTLAMSILPEEIPVAFTTFMALGTWRLMKLGIVVKQMKTVETLGSATVICTDKTGTLTANKMTLARLFVPDARDVADAQAELGAQELELIRIAMWASEPIPFDPMEIALHDAYWKRCEVDERSAYHMIHEYPLEGKPPMMTHIFENASHQRIIAAKGAVEALISSCNLQDATRATIEQMANSLALAGYRVLGVAQAAFSGNTFPKQQQAFQFEFKGLLGFSDPPKQNIHTVLQGFYGAGITLKIITGDHAATTLAIAKQIGVKGAEKCISGEELLQLPEDQLQQRIMDTVIFTRMFPEAKLKVINSLKANNQIVAMVGDGVNDGPALKAAHIGIAMGSKGTELAKEAAALVLIEDDLGRMLDAIAIGRKIYANLKKAIQYIISIHIPIILVVFIPLAFGWHYPVIFSPLHIIFMELIMGPTCSIIYENEPMEQNTMEQPPRPFTRTFFNRKELFTSVLQGLMITVAALSIYQFAVAHAYTEASTRTMVFTVLIAANICLTLVNRSFYYSLIRTLSYPNLLLPGIIVLTILLSAALIYLPPLAGLFNFQPLPADQLSISCAAGFIGVIWYELVKWKKRISGKGLGVS